MSYLDHPFQLSQTKNILKRLNIANRIALANVPYMLVSPMCSLTSRFDQANEKLGQLKKDPGTDAKLKIYALFKQVTIGSVTSKQPDMTDFVDRAKWNAWSALGSTNQEDAQKQYIDLVNSLVKEEASEAAAPPGQKYEHLLVTQEQGLRIITLNRPTKKNAINGQMYNDWSSALQDAANDSDTVITAITGAGEYYCSGIDLAGFMNIQTDEIRKKASDGRIVLNRFVSKVIDFPKPLVGIINGPAVGVSVSVLGLFDAVYSTDKATFHTPFSQLGQSPEGCSSFIFPRMMGPGKANEMLLFNKKLTAQEAFQCGLVTEVFPDATFKETVLQRLRALSKLPVKSLIYSKALARNFEKDVLHKVNDLECERLEERWASKDCMKAIVDLFSRKQ